MKEHRKEAARILSKNEKHKYISITTSMFLPSNNSLIRIGIQYVIRICYLICNYVFDTKCLNCLNKQFDLFNV